MMLHIPEVLTPEQVARCRDVMTKADWVDGNVTAGHQSRQVKYNLQLPEEFAGGARARRHGASQRSTRATLFMSAVLPHQVFPPLFNRYDAGMTFGSHVDNAIRTHPQQPIRIRTDVSATLFLSAPEDYDGGELVVEDTYGIARSQASGRRPDHLPGHQPAQRHADHPRLAHRQVLLDAEPDPRREQARAAVRPRLSPSSSRATTPTPVAGVADAASITTCCGSGPKHNSSAAIARQRRA